MSFDAKSIIASPPTLKNACTDTIFNDNANALEAGTIPKYCPVIPSGAQLCPSSEMLVIGASISPVPVPIALS